MHLGKNRLSALLAFLLLISASAGAQTGKNFRYQLSGDLQKSCATTSNNSITINYTAPELNVVNVRNEAGTFYRISIPGHISTATPGKPELPVYSSLISVPDGAEYKIKISEVKTTRINPAGKKIEGILYPSQEGETKNLQENKQRFLLDKTVYSKKGIINSDTVAIEQVGIVRNKNLANLRISPVRYNPNSNKLEVITSMKIEISFSVSGGSMSKSGISETPLFNESLSKSVMNYDPGDVVPGFTDKPVKMIILTDTAFKKQIEPLVKWKTLKGFRVKVLYRGTKYAGDTYLQLKDTLTKIYKSATVSDPAADYLLIIGDVNRIPYYGTGNVTDMYYAEYDGNGDYFPEMYVGRLPVADTTELKDVISKIIQYEKFEFAPTNTFYNGAIAAAGSDGGYMTYMNGQLKYLVTNYLTPQNNITESHFYYPSALTAEKDSIIKLINKGTSLINYTGHGDASGWLHLDIKVADTSKLLNNNMYPLIISNACRTAQYNTKYSFGNRMVLSKKKGAIGFIGCSNDSYWDEDYFWAVGTGIITADPAYASTGLGAFDRLFHTHSESPSDWYYTLGQINYAGNLSVSGSTSGRKKYYWETYNVIGDPSMIPITGKPGTFNISLPDTLPNEMKSLTLNIEPFSYIAISHSDTLWDASFASASGSVELEIPGLSNDSCMIVVTGQNRYPVFKTVYFSNVSKEYISLDSIGINDIQGNNNLQADFAETFYLKLAVSNLGLTNADGVYAKISSGSDWLTITRDSAFIGTLNATSQLILSDIFEITVNENVPDLSVATISILLKDNITEKTYTKEITLHSPELLIVSCTMDDHTTGDGDYIADPGETFNLVVRIKNQGSSDISGQLNIASQMSEITILEPSKNSGILRAGEITDIPVMVKLSESVPSGYIVTVNSTLDCSPFLLKKDFSLRVGRVRESFEASSLRIFPWINISSIPWKISENNSVDGVFSAQSGSITHKEKTTLSIRTLYTSADSLKFYYRVSSEPGYDYLTFKLNGKEIFKKSGEVPWTRRAVAVPSGYNQFEWTFAMDESTLGGSNCAWIDLIDFTTSGSVSYITKDLMAAKIVTPIIKDKFGMGTISVKVLNLGSDTIKGFNMAYNINDRFLPVQQYFSNKIPPYGDTEAITFTKKADLSKLGMYKIISYGINNNDDYILNDTVSANIENYDILDSLMLYPNPFTDKFTIFINSKAEDKLSISLFTVKGSKIYNTEKNVVKGKNIINIDDFDSRSSLYYLNIRGKFINKTIPVLKIN